MMGDDVRGSARDPRGSVAPGLTPAPLPPAPTCHVEAEGPSQTFGVSEQVCPYQGSQGWGLLWARTSPFPPTCWLVEGPGGLCPASYPSFPDTTKTPLCIRDPQRWSGHGVPS